jgi:hypothetical protein
MAQASTSAAFTADKVRAGTVPATEVIDAAEILIATAAAIKLRGEGLAFILKGVGFKPRDAGTAEPLPILMTGPPFAGAFSLKEDRGSGRWDENSEPRTGQ